MHQIRFRLELQILLGELTALPPNLLAGFYGPYVEGRGGEEGKGRKEEGRCGRGHTPYRGREGEKGGKERGEKGREGGEKG